MIMRRRGSFLEMYQSPDLLGVIFFWIFTQRPRPWCIKSGLTDNKFRPFQQIQNRLFKETSNDYGTHPMIVGLNGFDVKFSLHAEVFWILLTKKD